MDYISWLALLKQVKNSFTTIFNNSPFIELLYHKNDYADNSINIDGIMEIFNINGLWELYNSDGESIGYPHKDASDCIRRAIKLYAEYYYDCLLQDSQYDYELAEGPHSWKPCHE